MVHEYAQLGGSMQKYTTCFTNRLYIWLSSRGPVVSPGEPYQCFEVVPYKQIREFLTLFPSVMYGVLQRCNTE